MLKQLKHFFNTLNTKGNISLENVSTAMIITTLVGTVVVTSGQSVIYDSEEKSHVFNAQTLAEAAEFILLDEQATPALNTNLTLTLQDIYDRDRIAETRDPSETGTEGYSTSNTTVLVQNVLDNGRQVNKIFVKLVSNSGYVYTDETDTGEAISSRTMAKDLTRDDVLIPARDNIGF
jgi:hypothetical protein